MYVTTNFDSTTVWSSDPDHLRATTHGTFTSGSTVTVWSSAVKSVGSGASFEVTLPRGPRDLVLPHRTFAGLMERYVEKCITPAIAGRVIDVPIDLALQYCEVLDLDGYTWSTTGGAW